MRAVAARGGEDLLAHRIVHDGMVDATAYAAADGDAELREAMNEIRRAIERIDDPLDRTTARGARFLAEKGVVRVGPTDHGDDLSLSGPVDFGDVLVTTLGRHLDGLEPVQAADDDVGRPACGAHGDIE